MAYKQEKLTSHSSGGWKSETKVFDSFGVQRGSVSWFVGSGLLTVSSHGRRGEELSGPLLQGH